jgi:hypothetical protein
MASFVAFAMFCLPGCFKASPQSVCGSLESQKTFLDTIYEMAQSATTSGLPSNDLDVKIKKNLNALIASGFLKIDTVTVDQFDPNTGNIQCRAEISYHLPKEATTSGVSVMAQGIDSVNPALKLPNGLFSGHAGHAFVRFSIRKNATNGDRLTEVLDGADLPAYVAVTVATAQAMEDARFLQALADADGPFRPKTDPKSGAFQYIDTAAQTFPKVGACFSTTIREVGPRLEGDPDSGMFVGYMDGHQMLDYANDLQVTQWRKGDAVKLCVTDLPTDCPVGDHRGVGYRATNLRTGTSWDAGDSQHMCGGA